MKKKTRRGFGAIRKLPSGRYQASYIAPDGLRVTGPRTFVSKIDAEGFLSLKRREIDSDSWKLDSEFPRQEITFHELAERHIQLQNTRSGQPLKESTVEHYRKLLKGPLNAFGPRAVASISKKEVDDWWLSATKTGKRTTASKAYKLLVAVMKRALEDGLILSTPCSVRGAQSANSGKEIVCPTPEDVAKIAKSMGGSLTLMVLLMSYGGLRYGEITELRRKDISFVKNGTQEHYEIHVSRAVSYVNKKFVIGSPKSKASKRTIALTSNLNLMIRAFLDSFDASAAPGSLLFPSPTDNQVHMRNDYFAKQLIRAKKTVGLSSSGITPHSFRHFAGTYFASSGANLAEVKSWLGDSSTAAVQRYLHPVGRDYQIAQNMPFDLALGGGEAQGLGPNLKSHKDVFMCNTIAVREQEKGGDENPEVT